MTAFGGIAALGIGAMLLADASEAFVPVIGMVGGIAAMALANHERLKLRIEALEKAPGAGGMARRRQPRRVNCRAEITGSTVFVVRGINRRNRIASMRRCAFVTSRSVR